MQLTGRTQRRSSALLIDLEEAAALCCQCSRSLLLLCLLLTPVLNRACGRPSAEQTSDGSVEAAWAAEARAERRALAAEAAAARDAAGRAEAEKREAEALAATAVREADWQRAAELVAAQRVESDQLPPGCHVGDRAPTFSWLWCAAAVWRCGACGCRMALWGVRLPYGAARRAAAVWRCEACGCRMGLLRLLVDRLRARLNV